MGIMDSVLSFAKSCYQNLSKEKGANYVAGLYRMIGDEAKNMVNMKADSKTNQEKDIEER